MTWDPSVEGKTGDRKNIDGGSADAKGEKEEISAPAPVASREKVKRYAQISLGTVSLSVIDSVRSRELLTLCVCDILSRYADTAKTTKLGLTIGWIQLDHQLENCVAPVILAPTPVHSVQPTLQLSVLKDNMRSTGGLHSFMYCGILVQELDLKVEEDIIQSLWIFIQGVLRDRNRRHAARNEGAKSDDFQNAFEEETNMEKGGDGGQDGDEDSGMVGNFLKSKLYIEEVRSERRSAANSTATRLPRR